MIRLFERLTHLLAWVSGLTVLFMMRVPSECWAGLVRRAAFRGSPGIARRLL